MTKLRVLMFSHGHPSVRPGGAEVYGLELYEALKESNKVDPVLVSRQPPGLIENRPGTALTLFEDDPGQYLLHTGPYPFDWFYLTVSDKNFFTRHVRSLLLALQPHVVHFQHVAFMGMEMIRVVRDTLPEAKIVYTLHEFLPICHRDGQMLRTTDGQPCDSPSPQHCHECFPHISPQTFFLRKRFMQAHMAHVDLFIAPSRFLRDRYIDWGLAPDKIIYEENGRTPVVVEAQPKADARPRDRFAFFGQFNPYKGIDVLLEAMGQVGADAAGAPQDPGTVAVDEAAPPPPAPGRAPRRGGKAAALAAQPHPHLWLHGGNLDIQQGQFQARINSLLENATNVTVTGSYEKEDLPRLMANIDWVVVPSIWWENSPLVIREAFMYGRPIICSDIGGMAEKVRDGVDGIHFRAGDPDSLAQAIRKAAGTDGLWDKLHRGIRPVHPMSKHVAKLTSIYESLVLEGVPA